MSLVASKFEWSIMHAHNYFSAYVEELDKEQIAF